MSTAKSGNLVFLWLREDGSTGGWKKLVCNQELTLEGSAEEITANTKCGRFADAGTKTFTMNVTGLLDKDADGSTLVSAVDLFTWFSAGTSLDFIMGDNNSAGTIVEFTGDATISQWSTTANVDEFVSFSATFAVTGTPTNGL